MDNEKILDISWGTISKISIAVLVLYILFLIKEILIWFVFALIIAILFNPIINLLRKIKIPRFLGVIFVYIVTLGIITLFIYLIAPLFVSEIQKLSRALPQYIGSFLPILNEIGFQSFESVESFLGVFRNNLEEMTANVFNVLFAIFGGIFSTIFIVTVAIFLSLEEKGIEKTLTLFFSKKYEEFVLSLWARCQKKVSGWFWMRIIACLFVGIASYFAFLLLNLNYPFTLALIAGVFNFVPFVGPVLTGFLLFLIVVSDSALKALFVLLIFILIQQIENNVLTPFLSQKFIGLSPVLVLVALAVGGRLWGFMGAVLAVPLFGILFEFLRDYLKRRKEKEEAVL